MSVTGTSTDPERLVTLLTRQRELYRGLRTLSERQRATISGDRPELLLEILRERQDIVAALARLNEELGPFRRNWDSAFGGLPENRRAETTELLSEINALLRTILKTDQEDSALLAARKSAISAQLAEVSGSRAVGAAYARQASSGGAVSADIRG